MSRPDGSSSTRVVTVPNLLSFLRIALIPLFVALIVDPDTTGLGLLLFAAVAATDWVDGPSPAARPAEREILDRRRIGSPWPRRWWRSPCAASSHGGPPR
jgi:hypothetical protein